MPLGSAPRAGLSAAGSTGGVAPSHPGSLSWVSPVFPDFHKIALTISMWEQPTVCLSAKTKEGGRVEQCVWVPSGCGPRPPPRARLGSSCIG